MVSSIPDISLQNQRSNRNTRFGTAASQMPITPFQLQIHRCLCLLVGFLIFEGIIRKVAPPSVGIVIFLLKDFLTVILLLLCFFGERNAETSRLLNAMGILFLTLMPCAIATASNDPLLAVFGVKQYVLFPTVAVAMCAAYLPNHFKQLYTLFRIIALSIF